MNDENRLITPWGYIGYAILFAIPIVGLICVLVFSFSSTYPCRRNYARFILICYIIFIIIGIIYSVTEGVSIMNIIMNMFNFKIRL